MPATVSTRLPHRPTDFPEAPDPPPARHFPPRQTLRVLTYLNSLAPGGVERVASRLHAAWTDAGVDARMVLADGSIAPFLPLDQMHALGEARHGVWRFVSLVAALPRIVRADRPDVIFCAGNTYAGVAVCLRLLLGRRCPTIVAKISNDLVRRDMPPRLRWWYRRWLRLQGRYIDRFVGMAPAMRAEIAQLIGVPLDRIAIIDDPAVSREDIDRLAAARAATSRARRGRHFLAVGRLAPQKNFPLLLDAFARIAGPDDTLTILGEGGERAALEACAARLGIAAAVAMPGHVDATDDWLAQADALVLSSDYEGVPAVVIEALAAGLPIIATDCSVSMTDLLERGRLGTLVAVGDAAALAGAMAEVGRLPGPDIACRTALQRFTVEQAAGRYIDAMHAAVRARRLVA